MPEKKANFFIFLYYCGNCHHRYNISIV